MKTVIRTFFRTLRVVLGPVMLLKERLTQPAGVQRAATAQDAVDQQCQSLSLPIEKRDAQHHAANRNELLQGSGATKVPCLKITEADGQTRWLQDSTEIMAYLRERFSAPAV
jgi:hypothetical protein